MINSIDTVGIIIHFPNPRESPYPILLDCHLSPEKLYLLSLHEYFPHLGTELPVQMKELATVATVVRDRERF